MSTNSPFSMTTVITLDKCDSEATLVDPFLYHQHLDYKARVKCACEAAPNKPDNARSSIPTPPPQFIALLEIRLT